MLGRLLYQIPGVPPVNVQTNTKGLLAWFTQDHIVAIIVLVLCVAFVMSLWKTIKGHPILLLIIVVIALAAAGMITIHHPAGAGPAPIIPLPKGH